MESAMESAKESAMESAKESAVPPVEIDGEREPLKVVLKEDALDSDDKRRVLRLTQTIFQQEAFIWGDFPIRVPKSRFGDLKTTLDVNSLFISPNDSELEEVARAEDGKLKKLTDEQIRSIRETGRFSVPSKRFEGQSHVWELNTLLQKGRENNQSDFKDYLSVALDQIIIRIPNRIFASRYPVSFRNAAKQIYVSLIDLFDVVIGAREMNRKYSWAEVQTKLEEKWIEFLLSELKPLDHSQLPSMLATPTEEAKRSEAGKKTIPTVFETVEGLQLDLRLSFALRDKSLKLPQLLNEVERRAEREWEQMRISWTAEESRRIKLELVGEDFVSLSPEEKSRVDVEVANRLVDRTVAKKNELLLEALRHDEALMPFNELIVNRLHALHILSQIETDSALEDEKKRREIEQDVLKRYPVRARIAEWRNHKVKSLFTAYLDEKAKRFDLVSEAIKRLHDAGLRQEAYLMRRWREFTAQRIALKELLLEELTPTLTFVHSRDIWLPQNWKIVEHENTGEYGEDEGSYFEVVTTEETTITTRYPGWRIANFLFRLYGWWSNGLKWFLIDNQWRGPLGLRALLSPAPYYPSYKVDKERKVLVVNTEVWARVTPYVTLISELWRHIRESRERFEQSPDTGLLGKSVSRVYNVISNIVIKGVLGTTLLGVGFPALVALNTAVCLMAVVTSFVWAPALTLLDFGVSVVLYDRDRPRGRSPWFPLAQSAVRFMIGGIVQSIASLSGVVAIHPITAIVTSTFGWVKTSLRSVYDSIIYHLVLKRLARVPASDSFLARRVSGPGLAGTFYYQIESDLPLVLLEVQLEEEELDAYRRAVQVKITESESSFCNIHSQLFSPFGSTIDPHSVYFSEIRKRQREIQQKLEKEIRKRREACPIQLRHDFPRDLVRQKAVDLADTIQRSVVLVHQFYEKLWKWNGEDVNDFWRRRGLAPDSWVELAKLHLSKLFSPQFLVPLEEMDSAFTMKVVHLSLSEFTANLFTASSRDDLELVAAAPSFYHSNKRPTVVTMTTDMLTKPLVNFEVPPAALTRHIPMMRHSSDLM